MFNLFKKEKENKNDGNHLSLISVAALLIHSAKIDENFTEKEQDIIKKAFNSFGHDHKVIKDVDKKAYLSALSISDYIVVTCDSTSMISEASITGKPIYVAQMNSSKNNLRFQKFFTI